MKLVFIPMDKKDLYHVWAAVHEGGIILLSVEGLYTFCNLLANLVLIFL